MISFKLATIFILFAIAFGNQEFENLVKKLWTNFSEEQTKEAMASINDTSLTKGELFKRMNELIDKWGDEKIKVINRFVVLRNDIIQADRDNLNKAIEEYKNKPAVIPLGFNFSADAKVAFEKIYAILLDDSITYGETCIKINKLVDDQNETVKEELKLFKQVDCSKSSLHEFLKKVKTN